MLVPCTVESVRVHVLTNQHVVLLQAEGTTRLLPIWIGPDQAHSIATRIAGIPSERPLTHDLMVDMLTKVGAEITRVRSNGAFFSPELLITLARAGVRIRQVAVRHFPRTRHEPKGAPPRVILRAIRDLLQLRLRLWLGVNHRT